MLSKVVTHAALLIPQNARRVEPLIVPEEDVAAILTSTLSEQMC